MNNINYTGDWALDISNMDKAEWDQLVSILESKSVEVWDKEYKEYYGSAYLQPSWQLDDLIRGDGPELKGRTTVTLLQMLNHLETPTKSASQIKIEELQATIKLANDQIEALKEL
jgi:hypothetical protein